MRILSLFVGAVIITGTVIFFVQAANRDVASATPHRPEARPAERERDDDQAQKDERDKRHPDHVVASRPENVVWGGFPIDRPPVLTMQSGETVRIDALSQQGATGALNPVDYFAQFGVPQDEVLTDLIDFWKTIPAAGLGGTRPRYGPHILTGPVYVAGAAPGDTLEIQILDITLRVPYG